MENEGIFVNSKDKVLLSDMLFYIYNGFLNQPRNIIIESCVKFYDENTIWEEKNRFFEAIGKKAIQRRSNDRTSKNIEDIISEMELRDSQSSFLPVFAAVRLHNFPQTHDGSVSNAQLLGNINALRKEILSSVKTPSPALFNACGTTVMSTSIRHPLSSINPLTRSPVTPGRRLPPCPNVTTQLSLTSAPPLENSNRALSTPWDAARLTASSHSAAASSPSAASSIATIVSPPPASPSSAALTASSLPFALSSATTSASSSISSSSAHNARASLTASSSAAMPSSSTASSSASVGRSQTSRSSASATQTRDQAVTPGDTGNGSGNKRVRSSSSRLRGRKPLLVGKKVSDGRMSWRGADLTANYYIGHVSVDVDPKLITSDIESLGVRVVEFEQLELKHNRFKSFRLCIRKADFPKLLVEDFWPEEVVVDRFFRGKRSQREAASVS